MSVSRLKELRIEKGLTQNQLGELLNLSKNAIAHYENNERNIPTEFIAEFVKFFNVSADYFLKFSDNPNPVDVTDKNTRMLLNVLNDADISSFSFSEMSELENLTKTNISQIKMRRGYSADSNGKELKVAETRTKKSHD